MIITDCTGDGVTLSRLWAHIAASDAPRVEKDEAMSILFDAAIRGYCTRSLISALTKDTGPERGCPVPRLIEDVYFELLHDVNSHGHQIVAVR